VASPPIPAPMTTTRATGRERSGAAQQAYGQVGPVAAQERSVQDPAPFAILRGCWSPFGILSGSWWSERQVLLKIAGGGGWSPFAILRGCGSPFAILRGCGSPFAILSGTWWSERQVLLKI